MAPPRTKTTNVGVIAQERRSLMQLTCLQCGDAVTSELPAGTVVGAAVVLCPECLEAAPPDVAEAFLTAARRAGAPEPLKAMGVEAGGEPAVDLAFAVVMLGPIAEWEGVRAPDAETAIRRVAAMPDYHYVADHIDPPHQLVVIEEPEAPEEWGRCPNCQQEGPVGDGCPECPGFWHA